jgi:hypothetical protein
VLVTGVISLACAEWQRCLPAQQTWETFKIYFRNAHLEQCLVSQTALRSGYHAATMVVQTPTDQLPRSSYVADFYDRSPLANEEHSPIIATSLVNLATDTGSDLATVVALVALTKALAELTAFTQSQAAAQFMWYQEHQMWYVASVFLYLNGKK